MHEANGALDGLILGSGLSLAEIQGIGHVGVTHALHSGPEGDRRRRWKHYQIDPGIKALPFYDGGQLRYVGETPVAVSAIMAAVYFFCFIHGVLPVIGIRLARTRRPVPFLAQGTAHPGNSSFLIGHHSGFIEGKARSGRRFLEGFGLAGLLRPCERYQE